MLVFFCATPEVLRMFAHTLLVVGWMMILKRVRHLWGRCVSPVSTNKAYSTHAKHLCMSCLLFHPREGRGMCVIISYGHFYVEHNRGHHKAVGTEDDPATARCVYSESANKTPRERFFAEKRETPRPKCLPRAEHMLQHANQPAARPNGTLAQDVRRCPI